MDNPNAEFIERDKPLDADTRFAPPGSETGHLNVPLGTPPVDYDVRSVYDVRPIGGYDFNIMAEVTVDSTASSFVAAFQVPSGFVCVLREIEAFFDEAPAGIVNYTDGRVTLLRDNIEFPYNQNIPMGHHSRIIKTFLLADEFSLVGARFTLGSGGAPTFNEQFYTMFYGNFIPKLGRPYPFEIANPTGGSEKRATGGAMPLSKQPVIPPPAPKTVSVRGPGQAITPPPAYVRESRPPPTPQAAPVQQHPAPVHQAPVPRAAQQPVPRPKFGFMKSGKSK